MFGFFLKMYMITTTISFVIDYVYLCNFTLSMYKEGYRKLKKNEEITLKDIALAICLLFMPVVNMAFSLEILLNARKIKKSILKEGLEGWEKVYENLDNITINIEENINKEEKVKYEEIRKQFVTKSYDKMTNEEKLEFLKREKAFLENKAKSEEIVIKKKIL